MLALKSRLQDAETAKKKIIDENILDIDFAMQKDKEFIYFPLKQKPSFDGFEVIEKEFAMKKVLPARDLKTVLKDKLTEKEFERLKTSYDTVGSIAILEIDEDLRKKEKLIADALLESNKNIKTVLRKDEKHEGEFRTQKMKWLAGVKTKETIHKENGVSLLMNVEEVYFSTRLSTERKRIAKQVKKGENVLVMFSGCAPYPCVLAKNTEASSIVGIEVNPQGQKYGLKNLELNKIRNVVLINEDVKTAVPVILQKIIGLKSGIKYHEMIERMQREPALMEIHLEKKDLFEPKRLEENILMLKEKGVQVILHVPFNNGNGRRYNLEQEEIFEEEQMLHLMGELCKKHYLRAVVHVNGIETPHETNEELLAANIKKFKQYYDYFYFETLTSGFAKTEEILRIAKRAGIKNICIDINHLFITYKHTDKVAECIKAIAEEYNVYFHVSDHDFNAHTCEIGKGYINFDLIVPLLTYGVVEVASKNEDEPDGALGSYDALKELSHLKKFDRILMPLPKSAGDFLDDALKVSKKGTIIHFYYFLHEDKFIEAEQLVDEACKKAGKEWRKIELVKCGQHAPRVFRICLDFEVGDDIN
jgi:tRNA (guanine37-N1)-methyltransferase